MAELSLRQAAKALKKLTVHDRSILLVKAGSDMAKMENLQKLGQAITSIGLQDVLIVVVENLSDISVTEEKDMNRQGWYKLTVAVDKIVGKNGNDENEAT